MVGTANMNIVLGQGNVIKEIQNVKKQSLETNQQFSAQHADEKRRTEKSQVEVYETRNKIEVRDDDEKEKKKHLMKKKKKKKEKNENVSPLSDKKLLDITV